MKTLNQILKITAMAFLMMAIVSCDFTPRIHSQIIDAQELISKQEYKKAIYIYEDILKGSPSRKVLVKVYYQLAELYAMDTKTVDKAVKYYKLVKTATEEPTWLVKSEEKIADLSFEHLGDYKTSIESYSKLANFAPQLKKHDYYQTQLGRSYLNSGEFQKANDLFIGILRFPKHEYYIRAYYFLGLIHFNKKEWSKAIFYWREYVKNEKRRDNVVNVKFLMANAYETMEKLEKAYNLYYSILGEYPNTEVVKRRLNSVYERRISRKR